jgi:hypothetical protein
MQISRRIRCGDTQPGALSKVFGRNLYVYGGMIDGKATCTEIKVAIGTRLTQSRSYRRRFRINYCDSFGRLCDDPGG